MYRIVGAHDLAKSVKFKFAFAAKDKIGRVISTCMKIRAVHLAFAVDCSAMEFIQVLRRFFAFRVVPYLMIGDNGSQFIGAERQLREGWDKEKLCEFSAVAVSDPGSSTPEQMCSGVRRELQDCTQKGHW